MIRIISMGKKHNPSDFVCSVTILPADVLAANADRTSAGKIVGYASRISFPPTTKFKLSNCL